MDDKELFKVVGPDPASFGKSSGQGMSFLKETFIRLWERPVARISIIALLVLILGSIFVPIFSPYDIAAQDLTHTRLGIMQYGHILGTDNLGRDVFTRVFFGTRISLTIALVAVVVGLLIGAVYGGISGYIGGMVDNIMMRAVDIIISIPYMILVIMLMVIMKPGVGTLIIAYSAVGWTEMARLVRGEVIRLKEQEFVMASGLLGASPWYIIRKDILPNAVSVIIVDLTLTIPNAIFSEAFLSYIGLGVQIPLASLGTLANEGTKAFQLYPHLLIIPSAFIIILMLSFNLLGDSLRDVLDPRMRR